MTTTTSTAIKKLSSQTHPKTMRVAMDSGDPRVITAAGPLIIRNSNGVTRVVVRRRDTDGQKQYAGPRSQHFPGPPASPSPNIRPRMPSLVLNLGGCSRSVCESRRWPYPRSAAGIQDGCTCLQCGLRLLLPLSCWDLSLDTNEMDRFGWGAKGGGG
eukprot:1324848-Amorphochlora_amoeboformis.AAC.1